jgi:hypothetical protein
MTHEDEMLTEEELLKHREWEAEREADRDAEYERQLRFEAENPHPRDGSWDGDDERAEMAAENAAELRASRHLL